MIRIVFILRNCYLPIRCAATVRRWDSFLALMKEGVFPCNSDFVTPRIQNALNVDVEDAAVFDLGGLILSFIVLLLNH